MNNVDILVLESEKKQKLIEEKLDDKSIEKFKKNIKEVNEETKQTLGQELFNLISSKEYKEDKDLEKVEELILNGADVNYKDIKKGDFCLLICARKNYLLTYKLLLRAGANINQKNNYLTTACMGCARHGNKEILEITILMNADINAKCKDGDTALRSARRHLMVDCFYLLVNNGAYLNATNQMNETIYDEKENEDFNLQYIKLKEEDKLTHQDTLNIVEEATKKLQKVLKK